MRCEIGFNEVMT
jgi:hypothetical protein